MSVQAIIEFVGIIVLAGAPAPPSRIAVVMRRQPAPAGVVAIMPRITLSDVPTHTAAIVYPTSSGTLGGKWAGNGVPIPPQGDWSYLPLDGDQITFVTGLAPTKPPTRPNTLEGLKHDWENYNSGIPKLELDPGYTQASRYAKAAAVVRMTDGTLDGCHSETHPGRTETTARIDTNGVLKIVSNRVQRDGSVSQWGTLQLDVTQNSTFAIVNLPTDDLTGTSQGATGNHYLAYCAMANQSIDCPIPFSNPPDACPRINIALPEFDAALPPPPSGGDSTPSLDTTPRAKPMNMTSSVSVSDADLKAQKQPLFRIVVGPGGTRTAISVPPSPDSSSPVRSLKTGPDFFAMSADCSNTSWP